MISPVQLFSKALFLIICLLCIEFSGMNAQSNTVASGGDAKGSGGSSSYSVGQVNYATNSGGSKIITEGIQQPYEILVVTGIEKTDIDLSAAVYPNPATDFIIL